jgi:cyclopropane fatty-acyl-phospholipid synthase-like methyltransferase
MEFWHKEFIYAQDRVSDIEGNEFYEKEYRYHEPWYSAPIIKMLYEDTVDAPQVKNILDIGCGWGAMALYAQRMYGADVYCLDMEPRVIPFPGVQFKQANIEYDDIPFRWPFFYEKIIMTEIIEHLTCSPIPTLNKIKRILTENGNLYISTPNACDPLWGRIDKYYKHIGEMPNPDASNRKYFADEHIYQYTEPELLYIFDKAGFEVEKKELFKPPFWGEHISFKLKKKKLD